MTTLYEDLGVDPKADNAAIKKAYKQKAQKVHPDKGGDPKEFHKVQIAYKVLTDESRREQYDKDGTVKPEEKTLRDEAISELATLLLLTINQIDVKSNNVIYGMRNGLTNKLGEIAGAKTHIHNVIERNDQVIKRLSVKGGTNILVEMLMAHSAEEKAKLDRLEKAITLFKEMLAILSDYEYQVDQTMANIWIPTGTQFR